MKHKLIKPIPKHILQRIEDIDTAGCPNQKGVRMYSYLTSVRKELVKITVAVKNYRKKRYCKQVAAHGAKSGKCLVRDMEYMYFGGMGFRIGWYAEGIQKYKKWFEDGNWYEADCKYYNPWTETVNPEFISRFPEYRYSAYEHFHGRCIISYLRLYEKYPQVEYLLKAGLHKLHDSVMILKRAGKDKTFCKWLFRNRCEIAEKYHYATTILQAYKTGKPLARIQAINELKNQLIHDDGLQPVRELFKGKDLERLFDYLGRQDIKPHTYLDYLNACNYLGLDTALPKNRFPHDFKRMHDLRIDEFHSAKVVADEKSRAELYAQFAAVAGKYAALQKHASGYTVIIAASPAELMREGGVLSHCVGKMGYDSRMAREESLIFFVRDIHSPDTPFVTLEYSPKSKKILQCYGYENKKPDDTVLQYVNKVWLPHANKMIKKLTAAA